MPQGAPAELLFLICFIVIPTMIIVYHVIRFGQRMMDTCEYMARSIDRATDHARSRFSVEGKLDIVRSHVDAAAAELDVHRMIIEVELTKQSFVQAQAEDPLRPTKNAALVANFDRTLMRLHHLRRTLATVNPPTLEVHEDPATPTPEEKETKDER
jgi:hypothetical protein